MAGADFRRTEPTAFPHGAVAVAEAVAVAVVVAVAAAVAVAVRSSLNRSRSRSSGGGGFVVVVVVVVAAVAVAVLRVDAVVVPTPRFVQFTTGIIKHCAILALGARGGGCKMNPEWQSSLNSKPFQSIGGWFEAIALFDDSPSSWFPAGELCW